MRAQNADTVFLQEPEGPHASSILEMSRAHRINSGKTSLTLLEDGVLSAKTEFPLESSTGTLGANCTYGEHLAHFYADKGLWSYSDIAPVECGTQRIALTVLKDGAASSFKSAFKADADAKPPLIDVFFYAEGSGGGSKSSSNETSTTSAPPQDASSPAEAEEQKKGIYFCTVGMMFDGLSG